MTFPAYPEYKDSGVEWLGKVPTDWSIVPIKHASSIVGGTTPKSDTDAYWDGEFVWITPADLSKLNGTEIFDSQRKISQLGFDSCGLTLVPPKSIVLSTRAPIGSLGIASVELATNQGCKSLIPKSNIDSKFLFYVLSISTEALNVRGRGTTFLELSADELGIFRVPVPNFETQRSIANFLDFETAKIDSLIAEQVKLIELLNEKRQSIISNAVCRGHDPNVPMKDSGVEWLGMVPKHWSVEPLKNLISIQNGSDHKHIETTEGYPVVGSGGKFTFASEYMHDGESVLLGRKGTIDKPLYLNEKFWAVDTMYWSKILPKANAKFVYYSTLTIPFNFYSTNTALPSMTKSVLGSHKVACPDYKEQVAIAAYLDMQTASIDALVNEQKILNRLLNERRSALISAAVTGQIDVRSFQS
jgi:type I restriction enzyme S subunit